VRPARRARRERVPPRPKLDHHDPLAGVGGAPPAASALTLRLWLAGLALLCCVAGAVLTVAVHGPALLVVALAVVALTAVVDVVVVVRRRRGGEGG
jgi:Flp pilus assembly protein TadB